MSGLGITTAVLNQWRVRCQELMKEIQTLQANDLKDGKIGDLRFELKTIRKNLIKAAYDDAP